MEKSGNFRSIMEKSAKIVPEIIIFSENYKKIIVSVHIFFKKCLSLVKIVIFELFLCSVSLKHDFII